MPGERRRLRRDRRNSRGRHARALSRTPFPPARRRRRACRGGRASPSPLWRRAGRPARRAPAPNGDRYGRPHICERRRAASQRAQDPGCCRERRRIPHKWRQPACLCRTWRGRRWAWSPCLLPPRSPARATVSHTRRRIDIRATPARESSTPPCGAPRAMPRAPRANPKAVSLAGVSAAGPQSRVAAELSFGIRGSKESWWEGRRRSAPPAPVA